MLIQPRVASEDGEPVYGCVSLWGHWGETLCQLVWTPGSRCCCGGGGRGQWSIRPLSVSELIDITRVAWCQMKYSVDNDVAP